MRSMTWPSPPDWVIIVLLALAVWCGLSVLLALGWWAFSKNIREWEDERCR